MDRSGIYFFKLNISEFKFPRIPATEDLIRGYYKDEEEPVLWYVSKSILLDSNEIFSVIMMFMEAI